MKMTNEQSKSKLIAKNFILLGTINKKGNDSIKKRKGNHFKEKAPITHKRLFSQ